MNDIFQTKAQSIKLQVPGIDLSDIMNLLWGLIQRFLNCGLDSGQATTMMKRQGPVEGILLRGVMKSQLGYFDKKLFNATLAEGSKMKKAETQQMMNIVSSSANHGFIEK